ncbi:MAG TPA: type I-U CRISPR-associated protein Csx17 [Phycisphaerae bacterium]|nr:type I-U CRISPR-associated protein Csx17 [Phycisphaerae bacterium]
MAETTRADLELPGCTPEPLMSYLKALGILRLVSEQKEPDARGWWRHDTFWLRSTLDRDALVTFFLEEYKPTPIVVPWSGGDFFGVDWQAQPSKFRTTPTSSKAIEAILATQTDRFEAYRRGLRACKAALDRCGIDTKEKMGKQKWAFIQELRSSCVEPLLIEWMDAAAVGTVERFAALLGSGGGSDGNTHFSDNFMQNLWDVLADFDSQRQQPHGKPNRSTFEANRELVEAALFKSGTNRLIEKRTSSLYDSGAVGGPNATQGMERESLSNPWNVILALEGTVAFAGAATKRLGANAANEGAFPFQVSASVTVQDGLADKERAGTEVWLPVWNRPTRSGEVLALLREGRAQCGSRPVRTGVDMARAVASLGIDRGIGAFGRYVIMKGRVGGDNYNTAASMGRFHVAERANVDLLREIDPWLDRFRRAAGDKTAPPRFGSALRRIDSAIFEFCKYGGAAFFQKITVALGAAERELANAERFREDKKLKPLAGLSATWFEAADDGSPEFRIALALAGVRHEPDKRGEQPKIGPLRANLECVDWKKYCGSWAEKERCVVWNAADLATNLANVLARRMMDGARAGCERLPLASRSTAPLDSISSFIAGELDDERVEALIWGLMLIKPSGDHEGAVSSPSAATAHPLPRDYALLRLLYLARPLAVDRLDDKLRWRLASIGESGIAIRPEPRILPLLRTGRVGEACKIAAQRLRVSGLPPMPGPLSNGTMRDDAWAERNTDHRHAQRLAAALLIPISSHSVNRLVHLVCRDQSAAAEVFAVSAQGETE